MHQFSILFLQLITGHHPHPTTVAPLPASHHYSTTASPTVYQHSTLSPHTPGVLPPVRVPKYGSKVPWRSKRETEDPQETEQLEKPEKREADPHLWPPHSGLDHPFKSLKSVKAHYDTPYQKPLHSYNPTTPPPPPVHCEYKPTEKCKYVTKEVCEPQETEKNEEVCVEIPTQKADKVCKEKLRMECEVVEKPDRRIECDITPTDPPPPPEAPPPPEPVEKCEFIPR